MAFLDDLRSIATRARAIPGSLGLRPYTVAVLRRAWSGEHLGEGMRVETTTALTEHDGQPPKVRWLSSEQMALAGYEQATIEIGPMTPQGADGGVLLSDLTASDVGRRTEVFFVITGPEFPDGAKFVAVNVRHDRAIHYTVRAQRVAD